MVSLRIISKLFVYVLNRSEKTAETVPSSSFIPEPQVDSAVIKFDILKQPKIDEEVKNKKIIIKPYSYEQINPNSYNYRLGSVLLEIDDEIDMDYVNELAEIYVRTGELVTLVPLPEKYSTAIGRRIQELKASKEFTKDQTVTPTVPTTYEQDENIFITTSIVPQNPAPYAPVPTVTVTKAPDKDIFDGVKKRIMKNTICLSGWIPITYGICILFSAAILC